MSNEALAELIQAGIDVPDNMLTLYNQMSGLIARIAWQYRGCEDIEDLQQEGYLALYEAVDHYQPEQGIKFSGYAVYWIRQGILRYIADCGAVVRIPPAQRALIGRYNRLLAAYQAEYGRPPSDREAAARLGISPERLECLKRDVIMASVGSLDTPAGDDGGNTLVDLQASPGDVIDPVVDDYAAAQAREAIWAVVDTLPDKQSQAIHARYQDGCTLAETAARMGLNCLESARQYERKGIMALRRPGKARQLRPYLDVYNIGLHGTGAAAYQRTWTSATERAAIILAELCANM